MPRIIPEISRIEEIPPDYKNTVQHWGFFSREELEQNPGKLLMMDIDFGRYCSLECLGCFRRSNVVDDVPEGDMSYDELIGVVDQATDLGLRSVKICGAGEPTQNSRFLQFVRDMTDREVGVASFTKGQVLGDDEETMRFYGSHEIKSALELCKRLYELEVSFMVGFQSFYTEVEDQLVGGVRGHSLTRNQALMNLAEVGFNGTNPTRLAMCTNPLTRKNYGEVFDIYVYARQRNIYPVTAVLMTSGKQINKDFLVRNDVTDEEKINLWVRIYEWNIKHGIQTPEQIRDEGVSALPGIHPCNQISCGLYITSKGTVVSCPAYTEVLGNVRTEPLENIWERSENSHRGKGFNYRCPPKDGVALSQGLYSEVLRRLEAKF